MSMMIAKRASQAAPVQGARMMIALKGTFAATVAIAGLLTGCGSPPRAVVSPFAASATRPQGTLVPRPATEGRQILVKFNEGVRAAEIGSFRTRFQTRNVGQIAAIQVFIEEVDGNRPLTEVLAEINAWPTVAYAEANGTVNLEP